MKKHNTAKAEPKDADEISLDFSALNKFFGKWKTVNMDAVVMTAFIAFSLLLVMSIHLLPASLPITDDWAAGTLRDNVKQQVAQEIDAKFPSLPDANRNALIEKQTNEIITQNQAQFDATQQQISEQFKTRLRYTAEDGKDYTYVGDLDSYFWLRYTRNILRHGNTCDAVVDGQCRDMYVLAPVGQPSAFNPSFHVFAIYGVYKVITIFNPNYPLLGASFLVPVIIGMLGVLPAFFIGRRLAGNVGGLFAAILISLQPLFLSRSIGSDNDVWNVVVPLFIIWMAIEAFDAKSNKGRIIFSLLAALAVAFHSAVWEGWWFGYLIIFFAMIGVLFFRIAQTIARKNSTPWKNSKVISTFIIIAVFYIATYLFLFLSNQEEGYFRTPAYVVSASAGLDRAVIPDLWPNVLTTVAELNKSSFSEAVNSMGGKVFFLGALVGLLLLVLPRHKWHWKHYLLLAAGALISLYLVNTSGLSKFVVLTLLALPIAIMFLFYLREEEDVDIGAAVIILTWFLATIFATYSGVRFILIMIPAFGISFAVLMGRIYEYISTYTAKEVNIHPYIINTIIFLLIALVLIQPIQAGKSTARNFIPSIDDSWWDTLTKINKESRPDAIINSWWDFGHWFKYVADRRVSADGTSQGTHVPRWLGLALVTPDERTSIGTLRMLDCGSDTGGGPEAAFSAYGKVNAKFNDTITSQNIVLELVQLDKPQARDYLAAQGFTLEEQTSILNSTHCDPPEDFFITSGDMVGKAGVWAHFGLWNFENAYVVQHARTLPAQEGISAIEQKFNMAPEQAQDLYYKAKGLTSEGEINQFVAPWPGYITGNWMSCSMTIDNSTLVCPLGIGIGQQGTGTTAIDAFIFNISKPEASALSYGFYQNGQKMGSLTNGTPQQIVIAGEKSMTDINFTSPTSPGIAVLVDVPNRRILLADPLLVKSTFTQLFYLDGRYSHYYKKFDDQTGFTGSRVITWKVDWNGTS